MPLAAPPTTLVELVLATDKCSCALTGWGQLTGRILPNNNQCTDVAGNTVSATSTCTVLHDQENNQELELESSLWDLFPKTTGFNCGSIWIAGITTTTAHKLRE